MNPFFFGRSARQLFGAYDPPEHSARDQGVVLCPALGDEYLFAHGTSRFLARQLAAAGFHVLRFDYSGTGDSAGEFEDFNARLWAEDVETAIAEIKDLGQVSRVGLVGARFGAVLAARAAQQRDDVDQLVLWDPVSDGRSYLQEIGAGAAAQTASVDACGVMLTPAIRADIASVTAADFGPPLPKTLIVASSGTTPSAELLFNRLIGDGVECTLARVEEEPPWHERRVGSGAMSVTTAREIVSWMA